MAPYSDADRRLVSCAQAGDGAGVRAALRGGAAHHLPGPEGRLPLHVAAAAGHADAITGLLQAGADLHAQSAMPRDDGGRALHLAAEGGHVEALRLLAAAGAPLDGTDDKGRTAVHWAALRGQQEALVTLHTLGCDLHALDRGHANALHFAAASGSLETVRWLVEVTGVSVTQTDHNGRSPYAVAKRKGHKNMLAFLKQVQEIELSQQSTHQRQQSQASPSAWVYNQHESQHHSASWRGSQRGQHASVTRAKSQPQDLPTLGQQQSQHTYPPRPKSQHELPAQSQHQAMTRVHSHPDSASWDSSQRASMSSQRSQQQFVPRQQDSPDWDSSQRGSVSSQQQFVPRQQESPNLDSNQRGPMLSQQQFVPRQQDSTTWNSSQRESMPSQRNQQQFVPHQQESASWDSSQRGSMSSQQQFVPRQQDSATWNSSQHSQHQAVTRAFSQPESASWNSSQHGSLSRQQSQRSTSAWVESQQERQHQQQEREEPQSALALLTQQNQDYRKRIAQLEQREVQALQRNTADQASIAVLRKETERLTRMLDSEMQANENRLSEQDALHRQDILALRRQLEATPQHPPTPVPEALQREIESLRSQNELNQRTVAELTRRLTVAEESNLAMMAEARDRERSETMLRGEVDRLKLSLSAAPKVEAYAQLQARANRLSEQDALHRQAILALRRQLEATRTPSPAPQPPPSTAPEQKRLREALMQAEKSREEAASLSAKLQATQDRLTEADRLASAYKRQLGEVAGELREERERGEQLVAALREEVADLKGRMEAVKRRAVASLTRAPSSSDA